MQFLRRVLGSHLASSATPPLALYDSAAAPDSRRADTLLAALDIDAAINAHERWKDRLMDYLEGRTTVGLDPAQVRRADPRARWAAGCMAWAASCWATSLPIRCWWRATNTFMSRLPPWWNWPSRANGTGPCRCSMAVIATAPARWCCF